MAGLVLTEHLRVSFAAPRIGTGPLTFGQRDALLRVWDGSNAIWTPLALPVGTLLADIAPALSILLTRHEALRTRFVRDPEPAQVVCGPGVLAVDVLRIEPAAAEFDVQRQLIDHLRVQDIETGPPLRVAIAVRDGAPTAAAMVCSPAVADIGGLAVVARQFTELVAASVAGHPVTDPGPRGHQPLDQAEFEQTAHRDSAQAAVRYWIERLRTAPQAMFSVPPPADRVAEHLSDVLCSAVAGRALTGIAERTGAERQAVLLAAVCTVVSVRTGMGRFVFPVLSGNRDRLPDYVGVLAQDGLLAFDIGGDSFDAVVRRVVAARLAADTHACYDTAALRAAMERIAHERGVVFRRDFVFGAAATNDPELLTCQPVSLGPELVLALTGNPGHVTKADLAVLLRGVQRLLVAAAVGPLPLTDLADVTGVEPVRRGPGWALVDACWVDLARVRALVVEALRVPAAFVTATGDELVAYLPATARARTPPQAHTACMADLGGRYNTMAPGYYVLCAGVPDDPTDHAAWQALPVVAEGSGRSCVLTSKDG
jgi:hypothetical protein